MEASSTEYKGMTITQLGFWAKIVICGFIVVILMFSIYLEILGSSIIPPSNITSIWGVLVVIAYSLLSLLLNTLLGELFFISLFIYWNGNDDLANSLSSIDRFIGIGVNWWSPFVLFIGMDAVTILGTIFLISIGNVVTNYNFGDGIVNTIIWLIAMLIPSVILIGVAKKVYDGFELLH